MTILTFVLVIVVGPKKKNKLGNFFPRLKEKYGLNKSLTPNFCTVKFMIK